MPPGGVIQRSNLPNDRIINLLAHVLHEAISNLLKHGLERRFNVIREMTARIRGKIDLDESIKQGLIQGQNLICIVPTLSHNTPANRILKSTLTALITQPDLNPKLKQQLIELSRRFKEIPASDSVATDLRRVVVHRNNRLYRLAISLCRLWWDRWLVQDEDGVHQFPDFERDEHKMRQLFEKFVRNFYRIHLSDTVDAPRIRWQATGSEENLKLIPEMRTDVVITGADYRLVIDTKFTGSTRLYRQTERVKENYLYQIFAYVMNMRNDDRFAALPLAGVLLHPVIGGERDIEVEILGSPIAVKHLNLAMDWQAIEERLLAIHRREMERARAATTTIPPAQKYA